MSPKQASGRTKEIGPPTDVYALVAMLYSTYAIFASGVDAVMGGTIVMAIGFIIWGFIASRFVLTNRAATTAA